MTTVLTFARFGSRSHLIGELVKQFVAANDWRVPFARSAAPNHPVAWRPLLLLVANRSCSVQLQRGHVRDATGLTGSETIATHLPFAAGAHNCKPSCASLLQSNSCAQRDLKRHCTCNTCNSRNVASYTNRLCLDVQLACACSGCRKRCTLEHLCAVICNPLRCSCIQE